MREHVSGYAEGMDHNMTVQEDCALIERNELGAAHPDQIDEPTITEESVR